MESSTTEGPLYSGYLDGRIVVPATLGVALLAAAALLWVGTHGEVTGLLVLYYGGILAILVGVVFAFLVGIFVLGVVSLGGVLWLALERVAVAVGPTFGWAAPVVAVVGALLLPGPVGRLRQVARERRVWSATKGGSVPP